MHMNCSALFDSVQYEQVLWFRTITFYDLLLECYVTERVTSGQYKYEL